MEIVVLLFNRYATIAIALATSSAVAIHLTGVKEAMRSRKVR